MIKRYRNLPLVYCTISRELLLHVKENCSAGYSGASYRPWCVLFGRPFVKRFALSYRTVVCPVLSVKLVYCGQTVGRIKMLIGMEVGLGQGHIVLDGDPAPQPKVAHQ